MSNISRIQRAILINWKGMFYQPFDIDPGMTILEGANGTGKTTIMIAIYTCLIPDLNFLNFQNVTAASTRRNEDKGLYGRIGQDETNRNEPIFSVLDIITASGERQLVGVQLIKKTYPQVGLRHFAISNLGLEADIDQILIRHEIETNQQEIQELEEIADACSRAGGVLTTFRHAKDYFQFMFDHDISPIRLIENEERKKYNQLLHTSLYGGLSRTLQTSLRDYLLPENDKLVQGIQEMEQNLKTCRRTRSAINRYQSVQDVIQQVYNTGLNLYKAAFFATRLDAEQNLNRALKLRNEKKEIKFKWQTELQTLEDLEKQQTELERLISEKSEELKLAEQRLARCLSATKISREYEAKAAEHKAQLSIESKARSSYEALKDQLETLHQEEQNLSDQQMELAKQLSDAGKAWQELSKQVGLYQQAEKLLDEAKELMPSDNVTPDNITTLLEQKRSQFDTAKSEHQQTYFQLSETGLKQEQFADYLRLLCELAEEDIHPEQAGSKAREIIEQLDNIESRISASDQLPERIGQLTEQVRNRERLVTALASSDLSEITTEAAYDTTREALLGSLKALKSKAKEAQNQLDDKNSELRRIADQLPVLGKQQDDWDRFQQARKELESKTARSIHSANELANLLASFEEQLQQLYLERYDLKSKQKRIQKNFNTLINEGSTVSGLKTLAEQGHGSLLCDRYEDIPADWAANLESRLGPLSHSLVVKNVHKAANDLVNSFDRPDDLWLVEDQFKEKMPEAIEMGDSILVKHGDAWRLSRLSTEPVLGKEARALRVDRLGKAITSISEALEKNELKINTLKENLTLANKLSLSPRFLTSDSPLEQTKQLNQQQEDLKKEISQLTEQKRLAEQQITDIEGQEDVLRQFYPLKNLLDLNNLEAELNELKKEWEDSQQLNDLHKEKLPKLGRLKQGLEILQAPLESTLESISQSEKEARAAMDNVRAQLDILERLNGAKESLQFKDQVSLLDHEKSINQHTEKQLSVIEEKLAEVKKAVKALDKDVQQATENFHREEAKLNTLKGQLDLLTENLEQAGASGSDKDLDQARKNVDSLKKQQAEFEQQLSDSKENRYRLEVESKQHADALKKVNNRFKDVLQNARPFVKKWSRFHRQARNDGKFEPLLQEFKDTVQSAGKQSEVFWRKVSALRVTLMGKLEKIHDAGSVLESIKSITDTEAIEADQSGTSLAIWLQVQQYIKQVIPVDLQTSDPDKAQEAIGQKLESLQQNLGQQEKSLRIHVQSIPSHLNAEIRKQKGRIRKLNDKLETVRFGFLQAIRIHIETQPKLKRFLDILPQQLDIFADANQENVSIETLMADLYEREGAGKVRGDLLMDYRHYVRLSIEVKREGNKEFEKVTSTNLSTGESIGVGIAILIMVLMSWEEQSYVNRETENRGSLRFLLLDESSRLDQKALHTLTDFCSSLGLQLLIAAPSVERSLRGTTHHLTRSHFNGTEAVVVRGRRITAESAASATTAVSSAPQEETFS